MAETSQTDDEMEYNVAISQTKRVSGELKGLEQEFQRVPSISVMTQVPESVAMSQAPLHLLQMLPVDRANLSSAQGFLSVIQSSTNMAYHRIMGVLGQSFRPALCGISLPQHDDIRHSASSFDTAIEASSEEITVVDAASLRRQILKLNRRLQHLEEENKERAKKETVMYSITVAFWLLNIWLWLRR
ncbi:LOW QUALITY PROTEIN: mitochondrial fission factor-like [Mastomys coucha]|uniref:LOW QUALITY PROTEIN: mitochondrial fission factor-like n=1 Tax=Mastomys coucha TaxID=35658 RepID=UPI0012616657|nr:LOW QUALITY PROTEIN: mitochondrial fission factor-like [Mastomys coucha]